MTTADIFTISACAFILLAITAAALGARYFERRSLKEAESEFRQIFKRGRVLRIFRCDSEVFDRWTEKVRLRVIEYRDFKLWVKSADDPDDKEEFELDARILTKHSPRITVEELDSSGNSLMITAEWRDGVRTGQ